MRQKGNPASAYPTRTPATSVISLRGQGETVSMMISTSRARGRSTVARSVIESISSSSLCKVIPHHSLCLFVK